MLQSKLNRLQPIGLLMLGGGLLLRIRFKEEDRIQQFPEVNASSSGVNRRTAKATVPARFGIYPTRLSDFGCGGSRMKQFAVAILFVMSLTLIGCGSNSSANPNNVNGNWNATLVSGGNSPVFAFGTTMTVNSDGSVAFTNFSFTTNSSCFTSGETETGSFTLSGDLNGNVNGKFGMSVRSGTPAGNALALSGTVAGNTITGTWTLTGSSSCTGSGTFTMTKV